MKTSVRCPETGVVAESRGGQQLDIDVANPLGVESFLIDELYDLIVRGNRRLRQPVE